jgi:hypothetical protein
VLPWTLIAVVAIILPCVSAILDSKRDRTDSQRVRSPEERGVRPIWFGWWWAVGNLLIFSTWAVAKPNYYLPCVPGMALLTGETWLSLARASRRRGKIPVVARGILQAQWVIMFVAAAVAPVVIRPLLPTSLMPWSVAIALALTASVVMSAQLWRRGADGVPLAPMAAACVVGVLIAYGKLAPAENELRSHHVLARELKRILPDQVGTLNFFNEIDEGLWFYLRDIKLTAVPGTHPRYNTAYDLANSFLASRQTNETLLQLEAKRQSRDKQALIEWIDRTSANTSYYLLIRGALYDGLAPDLAGRAIPLLRERGLKRNELVLLQVSSKTPPSIATAPNSAKQW